MDPTRNPFAPGAGTQPPALVGREKVVTQAETVLRRIRAKRSAKGQMLLGLRGVGKTVLLNRIADIAKAEQFLVVILEAPENRRLAEMLVPPLRTLLYQLSTNQKARVLANKGLGILQSFASVFKVKFGELEVGLSGQRGVADSGNIEADLPALLINVAEAAAAAGKGVAILIDEVQYLSGDDLSALVVSAHQVSQRGLPMVFFGAGLPQLAGLLGEAKSYAERLFDYPQIGPLEKSDAAKAIRGPIRSEGADIESPALDNIVEQTKGYPYFLQEWGSHAWNIARQSPIQLKDAKAAGRDAVETLDSGFFRVRLDRLTPREKDYLRAMSELGPGPHRSGDIAEKLTIDVTTAGPLRNSLIRKGMIYAPAHGDTAFTVPMFDDFMRRTIPNWSPASSESGRKKTKK